MKTYRSVGAALADPNSNIARKRIEARARMADNRKLIDGLVASGMSREQAWAHALKGVAAMRER